LDLEIQEIKTYMGLGLTKNQARIYLNLTRSGISTVNQISNCSKVAREEVYRVCPKLVNLGLIEKAITSPIRFEAVPIEEGISLLVKRRTREINDLHKKAIKLATITKKFGQKNDETNFQNNHSNFVMIPKRAVIIKRIKQATDSAQESVSIITSMKRHPHALFVFDEEIKNAISRGVKFRVIVGEIKEDLPEIAKKFSKHPLTSVKYISSSPTAVIMLVDKSKGFIITSPTAQLEESPALQLKNLSIVKMLQEYFEYVWSTALEENETHYIASLTFK